LVAWNHIQVLKLQPIIIRLRLRTPNWLNVSKTLGLLRKSDYFFTIRKCRLWCLPLCLHNLLLLLLIVFNHVLVVVLTQMLFILEQLFLKAGIGKYNWPFFPCIGHCVEHWKT
jgi:hypothetical protein